ncbi:hypothetical protein LBMAG42_43940 [Deltaproteobacteria bacterium]|nr:hypothetical protein LBMAG42_43940 [Deltaproteobacteria bacterium]
MGGGLSTPPPPPGRLILAYDPHYRAAMTVPLASVEDPVALAAAAEALPASARSLLDLLLLVSVPGEPIPERLRDRVAKDGQALWLAAMLLPRASSWHEGSLHPQHYSGSCRLNPGLAGVEITMPRVACDAVASFPPADVRWDAVVVAAALEATPAALTQDGVIRRDVERRLYSQLGDDDHRWSLALRYARAIGLVRATGGRLHGLPDAHPRPAGDIAALLPNSGSAAAATLLLRLARAEWTSVDWLETLFQGSGREALYSPLGKNYPQRSEPFDDAGLLKVEYPALQMALDVLHRVGVIDAARDHDRVLAFRLPQPRPKAQGGFLLTPDGSVLCHVAELRIEVYSRLARVAPFVDGDTLRRHRLTRDGIVAELGAGHRDTIEFLAEHSRTGVPSNVVDQIREWQRSATRLSIVTGVDVVEEPDGRLRIATAADVGRVIDYTTKPRARFVAMHGKLFVPDGWDPLDLRSTLARIARPAGREGESWVYEAELRAHTNTAPLLARLREYHGGDLPGEIEALVLAGAGLPPVVASDAVIVKLPIEAASALRRDRVAGALLRRTIGQDESVVPRADLEVLRARMAELGIGWSGVGED